MTTTPAAAPALTSRDGQIWREGAPYRLLSGSIHYFRVHPDQWEDRLRRLAAMGANTVDTYVAWNFHEKTEGEIDFSGWADLERFVTLAGEVGLEVLLRPSPYICAEWTNGGLPSWLTGRTRDQRTSEPQFLAAIDNWYDALIPRMAPLQKAFGGPIVAVQVENEYGSFGSDDAYLEHLRDGLRARGIVELLTTADGTQAAMQHHGSVAGAMPTFTFGSGVQRAVDLLPSGVPLVCGELWGGWFDHWGENHHVRSVPSMMGTVDDLLGRGGSVSMYMAHGGTNFGLTAGANHDVVLQPTVTSYDSDAPIGEDGRVNAKFTALREAFTAVSGITPPALPADPVFLPEQTVTLTASGDLISTLRALPFGSPSPRPLTFEELGLAEGVVVYRATVHVPVADEDPVLRIPTLHDRATVFLDGERLATLERDGVREVALPGPSRDAELIIAVENLGRINYGALLGEHKGLLNGVLIGRRHVHGWTHAAVDLDDWAPVGTPGADGFAAASVTIEAPADAWLAFPDGAKGFVWLNGFLLGRYWERGPQVTLYAPAPLWRAGVNEIRVLDLDRLGASMQVRQQPEFGPVEEFIGV